MYKYRSLKQSSGLREGAPTCPGVLHFRKAHEVCGDIPLVLAVLVGGHQRVDTVVDVSRDIKVQTAMVLALRRLVDLSLDVVLLLQGLALVVPQQFRFGVPSHAEGDAPILAAHGLVQI